MIEEEMDGYAESEREIVFYCEEGKMKNAIATPK